jgi:hypothetical protein
MLMVSDSTFFPSLTTIAISAANESTLQKAAIVTLNTLAIRSKQRGTAKDYLGLDQIYQCLKQLLSTPSVSF